MISLLPTLGLMESLGVISGGVLTGIPVTTSLYTRKMFMMTIGGSSTTVRRLEWPLSLSYGVRMIPSWMGMMRVWPTPAIQELAGCLLTCESRFRETSPWPVRRQVKRICVSLPWSCSKVFLCLLPGLTFLGVRISARLFKRLLCSGCRCRQPRSSLCGQAMMTWLGRSTCLNSLSATQAPRDDRKVRISGRSGAQSFTALSAWGSARARASTPGGFRAFARPCRWDVGSSTSSWLRTLCCGACTWLQCSGGRASSCGI
mmetsp:Transcript_148538/g.272834  ORF Transcript_148538/g.272834 Transcript_148538/m.272834 type:complete len:259 (+) Transcript_148538:708-1484(+)